MLKRRPGKTRTSEFGLLPLSAFPVFDVNRYYAVLGVTPNRGVSRSEIKRAYRRIIKTVHPDVGGDSSLYEHIQCAIEVLGDPDKRSQYDRMLPPALWQDSIVHRRWQRIVARANPRPPRVRSSVPSMQGWEYYVEGDLQASDSLVRGWLECFARAEYERGRVGPVRLGFTDQSAHVQDTSHGAVYMVPLSRSPSLEYAKAFVAQLGV